ncbi:hypothetical protein BGV68_01310 [Burkholderia ubonensis]|nr:hypothetical protein BGV68_01310 [Burkholderia ubonensis]
MREERLAFRFDAIVGQLVTLRHLALACGQLRRECRAAIRAALRTPAASRSDRPPFDSAAL